VVPDKDKKVSPKRAMICILSVFVAFFFSVFMAFILEFVQRIQQEDPERYQSILKEIPFWKANQRPDRKID
jgi:capsular polysaccharide biosynthesis protein